MAVSSKPWGAFSAADYTDANTYADACLIDLNPPGKPKVKGLCKLPVKEPNGDVNANAVHAAASVLAGGRGGVDAPPAAKKAAAKRLLVLYRQMQEDPPVTIQRMAQ